MHWHSAHHYAVIVQQERLQGASGRGRGWSVPWIAAWRHTLSKIRADRRQPADRPQPASRIALQGESALPKSGSPT